MNARSRTMKIESAHNVMIIRFLIAVLAAFLLFNLATTIASADKVTNFKSNLTQNQFTGDCRLMGGTPKREDTHIVSCTYGSGSKTTCDFNKKPAECVNVQKGGMAAPASGGGTFEAAETTADPIDFTTGQVLEADSVVDSNSVSIAETDIAAAPAEPTGTAPAAEPVEPMATEEPVDTTTMPSDVQSLPEFGQ